MPGPTSHATCECTVCFYCEMPLPKRHEHDHMPVPKAFGGDQTVSSCMNCHELKDRTPLDNWRVEDVLTAMASLPPLGRILLAKIIGVGFHSGQMALFK